MGEPVVGMSSEQHLGNRNGMVVLSLQKQDPRQMIVARVEFLCHLTFFSGFLQASIDAKEFAELVMGISVVGIERDGLLVVCLRSRPITNDRFAKSKNRPCIRKTRGQSHGSLCRVSHDRGVLIGSVKAIRVRDRDSYVSRSEIWIGIDRLLEIINGLPVLLVSRTPAVFVQVIIRLKIGFKRLWGCRPRLFQCYLGWRSEPCLNLARNLLRHVAFERENVTHITLEAICPNVFVGRSVDKLCSDAHAVARSLHRTFYDAVHSQLARNFRE